ncbi:MAG: hypothetical protein ABI606_03860 [Rhodoferax sp.]
MSLHRIFRARYVVSGLRLIKCRTDVLEDYSDRNDQEKQWRTSKRIGRESPWQVVGVLRPHTKLVAQVAAELIRVDAGSNEMGLDSRKALGLALLMWLLATITLGLQTWIGDETIYSKGLEQQREEFHFAILANKAPGGTTWGAVGALSIQKRIGVVYLAEIIRKYTGLAIGKIYKLLDSVFLFISLLSLFFYLKKWVPDIYCLLGVLYFCAVLPLTYFFQLFHPWDRLQLAIWIGLLYLVAERRFLPLAVGLVVSIFVKFDTILLPFFYFMVHFTNTQWRRTSIEALALLALAFGTYSALGQLFPAPLDASHFTWNGAATMLLSNARALMDMNVRYPPLLVHALPLFLSLFFLHSKDRFVRYSVAFALGLTAVYVLFSNYKEVRAHMVVLVLLLPSVLISLRKVLERSRTEVASRNRMAC